MDRDRDLQVSTTGNSGDLVERRANAFAAAFLLPEDGVEHFLTNIDKGRTTRQTQVVYDVASNGKFDVEGREAPGFADHHVSGRRSIGDGLWRELRSGSLSFE